MRSLWRILELRIAIFAFLLYGVIFVGNGIVMGGDSNGYLQMAQEATRGDFSTFAQYPFHGLYALILSVGYLLHIPTTIFVTGVNIAILVALPVLFYRVCLMLTGQQTLSYWAGLAIMFQVNFIFWGLFVLTDTLFLTLLTAFVLAVLWTTQQKGSKPLIVLSIISVPLLFSRPVSVIALPIGWLFVLDTKWGPAASMLAFCLAGMLVISTATSPALVSKILALPTVYQSLWLSTKVSTNNVDDITEAFKYELPPGKSEADYKLEQFREFLAQHPVRYTVMCVQRLVAYWYPWIWGKWGLAHRAIDFVYSVLLTFIALAVAYSRRIGREKWLLLSLAFGFSLLSVFGQIDSDVRYRLPAELCILILVPTLITSLKGDIRWSKLAKTLGVA